MHAATAATVVLDRNRGIGFRPFNLFLLALLWRVADAWFSVSGVDQGRVQIEKAVVIGHPNLQDSNADLKVTGNVEVGATTGKILPRRPEDVPTKR